MPETTLRDPVTVLRDQPAEAGPALRRTAPRTFALGYWPRAGIVAALTVFASLNVFTEVLAAAAAGSRTAYLVALPVWAALIAHSYRQPSRGVTDTETDWIAVLLVGAVGFTGLHLLAARMPTTAAAWGLPAMGALLCFACAAAALFGIRHVVRMWPLWLFSALLATPLPYLLTVAALGGSAPAAAGTAAAAGVAAVWLSTRSAPVRWRLSAGFASAGAATAYLVSWGDALPLVVDVLVAGAAFPVLACVAVWYRHPIAVDGAPEGYPRRSPASLVALTVAAAALFALQPPAPASAALPVVDAGWISRAGLGEPIRYDFATRYLGPGATLSRYSAAPQGDQPAAVIDVLSSPDRQALEDYAGTVWYPSTRPVQYQTIELSGATPLSVRIAHTDAGAATTSTAQDWYAVTWLWHTGGEYQQVTVVVNQRADDDQPPPAPTPPSLRNGVIEPALWIARQQGGGDGEVNPDVLRRARDLAEVLVASAGAPTGTAIGV